jgi:hypothetical protein
MEPEGSSSHSQEPTTCPYPERDWSSPCPPPPLQSNLSKIHFNSSYELVFQVVSFPQVSPLLV